MEMKRNNNRQEVVINFIDDNYNALQLLRHDIISDKLQIRSDNPQLTGLPRKICGFLGSPLATNDYFWRDMTTADVNDIVCNCAAESGLSITPSEVLTVLKSHRIPYVHPLREYVLSCPDYTPDQPDWIGFLAEQVTIDGDEHDQQLWTICFRKWFVAMVAAWLDDNVVNQQVLVLIGRQGIFKTTWLERLIPPQLRNYSCKMANAAQLNKDERLRIAEYGLIALDEIDAMTPRELNVMKSVITASDVAERAAYAYQKERRIRLASFCASGNKKEFLTDITGNRRWLPFLVRNIQNPFFTTIPYQQIYAQAIYLIRHDFNYWFDLEDINALELHNEDFRAQENEEQLLPIYFDIPAEGKGKFLTTAEISDILVTRGSIKKPMPLNRLGILLKQAGFLSKQIGAARTRGWIVYEKPLTEVELNRTREAAVDVRTDEQMNSSF